MGIAGGPSRPVAAVLDYFHLEDVTLIGYSLGGCLTVRAAAYEPRVSRVVCDDILVDFAPVILGKLPAAKRRALQALLATRASSLVNAIVGAAARGSLFLESTVKQGMLVTGTTSPYGFLRESMRYETASVSRMLTQDVLLMAGAEDFGIPVAQLGQQLRPRRWRAPASSVPAGRTSHQPDEHG